MLLSLKKILNRMNEYEIIKNGFQFAQKAAISNFFEESNIPCTHASFPSCQFEVFFSNNC